MPDHTQRSFGWRRFVRSIALFLGILAAGAIAFLWYRRPSKAARTTCERYTSLLLEKHCRDAYQLDVRSTYPFSTLESFCRDNDGISDNFLPASARCNEGEWHGTEYVMFGDLRRPADNRPVSFGMRMRRQDDIWLVVDFDLAD